MENNSESKIYLGFDVSTTCIGTCIYMDDGSKYGKVLKLGAFPLVDKKLKSGIESLFIKKQRFVDEVLKPYKEMNYKIDKIVIEDPLLRSNNINTVAALLKFNGMISNSIYDIFGMVPEFISSHDARYYAFPGLVTVRKFTKKGEIYELKKIEKDLKSSKLVLFGEYPWDVDKKEVMFNKVNEAFPHLEWQYNKKGELAKENYDANDALITCIGIRNKDRYGTSDKVKVTNITKTSAKDNVEFEYTTKIGNDTFSKRISLQLGDSTSDDDAVKE